MIAFKVYIGEVYFVTAGQDDWSVLATHVDALRDAKGSSEDYELRLSVGGLSRANEHGICQHFRWQAKDLKVGDSVRIEIIDTDNVEAPRKRYRSDHEVQEDPFTEEEAKELRYQDYLELKEEFEPHTA